MTHPGAGEEKLLSSLEDLEILDEELKKSEPTEGGRSSFCSMENALMELRLPANVSHLVSMEMQKIFHSDAPCCGKCNGINI